MGPERKNLSAISSSAHSGRLALRDQVTGLLEGTLLADRIDVRIAAARRSRCVFAILYVDIDRLDCVCDMLGRAAADALLRESAARMERALRASDAIARVNEDEFAVLLDGAASAARVGRAAERLACACRGWYEHDDARHAILPSVGMALYPRDGATPETLLRCAEAAMHYAKTVRNARREPAMITGTRYSLRG